MADREVPLSEFEVGLVEDLGDQAHVLVDQDLRPSLTAMPADSWPRCCSA